MKREMNDEGEGPQDQKRNRRNEETVRILIPSSIAGAVIGKGGQHIQKMRTQNHPNIGGYRVHIGDYHRNAEIL